MLLTLHLPFKVNIAKIILSRSGATAMCNFAAAMCTFAAAMCTLAATMWVAGLIKTKTKLNPQLGLGLACAWQKL